MITTNAAEVIAILRGVAARTANARPALERIAERQASRTMLQIMADKDDPEGREWAPWQPSTRAERERKGNAGLGLLWDEGTLLQSINVQVNAQSMAVGTNSPYAPYLQDGTKKMPARPFLGWGAADIEMAERTMLWHIAGPLTP